MRPTIMEINKKNFIDNINKIKKYVPNKELIPIIKANGYGTHINKDLSLINPFNIVGVAIIDEAIELRRLNYKKDIFVLNQPSIDDLPDIIKYNITIGISELTFIKELIKVNKRVKVHLEIETGMNRTGINPKDLDNVLKLIEKNKNIIIEGIYTHLSSADNDPTYTKKQLEIFETVVNDLKPRIKTLKYIHSSASNGLLNYTDKVSNTVRPGLIIYGYETFKDSSKIIKVKPISTLKTKITFLKEVEKDTSISYGRKYISRDRIKVATIPIGYADGLRRELSNIGYVVIKKQKAPIIGSICMDSCMIDVTNIKNVKVGDEVYIWDNKIRTIDDIAEECHTINYEILCGISDRVQRVFID